MAALEEFELGIDHIRNAFKRADNGFANAYKLLEAEQQKNHKLEDENAKLKNNNNYLHEMLSDSIQANEHLYAELKRHKSILRTRPNAMTALYAENAKLRELAEAVKEFVEDTHCEDCPCRRDCDDNNHIFCANDFSYHAFAAMRELGIEVGE